MVQFLIAAGTACLFTPVSVILAYWAGAIDIPCDGRRMHSHPVPRLGGAAIILGFLAGSVPCANMGRQYFGMHMGALAIIMLGVSDDIYRLTPFQKLPFQIAAAFAAAYGGNTISSIHVIGASIPLGHLGIPFTMLWVVGLTNAFNLLDGIDGLACGTAGIAALFEGIAISSYAGDMGTAGMAYALSGACLGFLPYNWSPASSFMGDTGSTFLGYMLSVLSAQGMFQAGIPATIPIIMLGIPIFEAGFTAIRRAAAGKPIFMADKGHTYHRIAGMGFSVKQTVALLLAAAALLGAVSLGLCRLLI